MGSLSDLQREWYGRLARDGFKDIECGADTLHPGIWMPEHAGSVPRRPWRNVGRAEYYRAASALCYDRALLKLPPDQRRVWRLHAQGLTPTEISRRLGCTVKKARHAVKMGRRLILRGPAS